MNNKKHYDRHNQKKSAGRITLCGILCAAALVIFVAEAQLPPLLPVPGVKLGLANIITLFALLYLTPGETALILVSRILLGAAFCGQPSAILYSLCGGILCLIGEMLLLRLFGRRFICEISVVGAMLHNIGQLCCAALITKTAAVFSYLPVLLIAGAVCGAFCGLCILLLDRVYGKKFIKMLKKDTER